MVLETGITLLLPHKIYILATHFNRFDEIVCSGMYMECISIESSYFSAEIHCPAK
jgi:hypothetical protein